MSNPPSPSLSVSVWRSAPPGGSGVASRGSSQGASQGATQGAFQTFAVPARTSQTVLDVVAWIQQYADPTLSYRYACRVGMCGSCAMMVERHSALDVQDPCRAAWSTSRPARPACGIEPLAQPAGHQGSRRRYGPVLRQVGSGRRRRSTMSDATRDEPIAAVDAGERGAAGKRMPVSSASTAPSATPPATWWRAMRTISAPPPSTGRGPSCNDAKDDAPASRSSMRCPGTGGCHNCHSPGFLRGATAPTI